MMIVRRMDISDVAGVYDIACRSLDESYVQEVFFLFINTWPSGQLVASDPTGKITGFISGSIISSDRVTIMLFAVDNEYRGMGIGDRLFEEFRMNTIMSGKRYIQLEVRDSNVNAISFYRKRGFTEIELIENFYNDGGNAVRMVRHVNGNV